MLIVINFVKYDYQSSYEIINSRDNDEYNYGKEMCEDMLAYLENKYNEKFHIKYEWYSDE